MLASETSGEEFHPISVGYSAKGVQGANARLRRVMSPQAVF
jgi:hypothetical protein